ncbi:hypothetical protein DPMN_020035 [Dreissena polymorpha]|uniref:Uncharacterized protein n=1 Tax=Dreissena polymorpha TaxID=45954 RepID=A0A9D4NJM0_DREPO|nr:hypothetical protein DPMN_020035 [Dreissena polymorpha]
MRQIHSAKVREVDTGSASLRGTMLSAAAISRVNTRFGRHVLIILPYIFCKISRYVPRYSVAVPRYTARILCLLSKLEVLSVIPIVGVFLRSATKRILCLLSKLEVLSVIPIVGVFLRSATKHETREVMAIAQATCRLFTFHQLVTCSMKGAATTTGSPRPSLPAAERNAIIAGLIRSLSVKGINCRPTTGTIFEIIQDIININGLTKFHEEWTIHVTLRVKNDPPPGGHVFQPTGTISNSTKI